MTSRSQPSPGPDGYARLLAALIGCAAGLGLVAFYRALVSAANSPVHAFDLLWADKFVVAAIAAGFGLQAGQYAYVRLALAYARAAQASGAMAVTGTGTSTAAMVACCAHHLVDVLPVIGLSGAALSLNDYRVPVMLAGITVNAAGIIVMPGVVRTTRVRIADGSHVVAGGIA